MLFSPPHKQHNETTKISQNHLARLHNLGEC